MALGLLVAAPAGADCLLVRERDAAAPTPHLALHFGNPADVPRLIQCATSLDKNLPTLCVPIYAYNLWDGASGFQFAISTPRPPIGFDRGSEIMVLQMKVDESNGGALTSLDLAASVPVCGPVLLGCLRLPTADLPESFQIAITGHSVSGRCAVQMASGEWWTATGDRGGARVGTGVQCGDDACAPNEPIADLRVTQGGRASIVDVAWTSGSGNYTMLRYRTDGRYPVDPWDGELLGFLPSNITQYSYSTPVPGELRIAAWSITRSTHGDLMAVSNVECGALTSILIQLPVTTVPSLWGGMKSLYR